MLDNPVLVIGVLVLMLVVGIIAGPLTAMRNVKRDPPRLGEKDPFSPRGNYEKVSAFQACMIPVAIIGLIAYAIYLVVR